MARADHFADSLGGSALSAALKAPIFLTKGDRLDVRVGAQLREGGFTKVIVLGGTGAISADVEAGLNGSGYQVTRLGGVDRYETSLAVAKAVLAKTGGKQVLLTSGVDFPDALAAGAGSARVGGAVLLTHPSGVSPKAAAFLRETMSEVTAVGGPAQTAVKASGLHVKRSLTGTNRYATATMVAKAFFTKPAQAMLASGVDFPDTLAAGAVAGLTGRPLLLSTPTKVPAETLGYLREAKIAPNSVQLVGGSKVNTDLPKDYGHDTTPGNTGNTTPGGNSGNGGNNGAQPGGNPGGNPPQGACAKALPKPELEGNPGTNPLYNVNDESKYKLINHNAYDKACDRFFLEVNGTDASNKELFDALQLIFDWSEVESDGAFKVIKARELNRPRHHKVDANLVVQRGNQKQSVKADYLVVAQVPQLELSTYTITMNPGETKEITIQNANLFADGTEFEDYHFVTEDSEDNGETAPETRIDTKTKIVIEAAQNAAAGTYKYEVFADHGDGGEKRTKFTVVVSTPSAP